MKGLTKRQQEVVNFIQEFIQSQGYPPTVREIGGHFGISVKAAFDHLKALKKKGILRSSESRSRSLEIINDNYIPKPEVISVPVLGNVAAGIPLLAEENFDRTVSIASELLKPGSKYYALQVQGDSMIDAGIHEGDLAVIRYQQEADNGDIVIAKVNEEAVTLKRFFRENNRIRLQAENADYLPTYTQEVQVLGVLQLIIRSYA